MPKTKRLRPMFLALIIPAIALAAGLTPVRAHAQARSLDVVGHLIGGDVRAVAPDAGRAYAGVGHRLAVLDAAQPGQLRSLGVTALLPGNPVDIRVAGSLAHVATTDSPALVVVDVSEPTRPRVLSTTLFHGGFVELGAGDFASGLAYLAGWTASIESDTFAGQVVVMDVREPTAPRQVGRFSKALGTYPPWVVDISVVGQRAFVTLLDVVVLDISDPTQPQEVATFGLKDAEAAGIAVAAGRAYVPIAAGAVPHSLRVFDVSDPDRPRPVAAASLPRVPMGIAVAG